MNWLNLPINKQIELFNQLSFKTGILPQAIEKDAWVTLVLRALFRSDLASHIVFKGGTSLSKGYGVISRLSEDIDIAISREYLGFQDVLIKGEIRRLRKKLHQFVSHKGIEIIQQKFNEFAIAEQLYTIEVKNKNISDQDPEIIQIDYASVFEELPYLKQSVLIEIGARSLMEPTEFKEIKSLIDAYYSDAPFSEKPFTINTALPEKTFLEKLLLLHEEFTKPLTKIRHHRMSRHLYDIGQLLETKHGQNGLSNTELFNKIIQHRAMFTPIKTVNYSNLKKEDLRVIPPENFIKKYESDYKDMQENMIYGTSRSFSELIELINTHLYDS